ncbi:STAS-like domain-containing protein [Bacillus inaquosorum]|uniref:STAS-like domain-containing protein n=1 Tax=Bacillus inaquosorum TaxID=483913 RepID=UPI00227EF25F|nr:STAS-like domain-containing protein [Bacillus inaquosorum]MCY8321074.1 STAS-like domain-containing protein [Bacillus inaquosorum]MCY8336652.1 STAS-like domain-containing protein [Bacillus inaquosorum]
MGRLLINVLSQVERCYSNEDGQIIFSAIDEAFQRGNKVALSFKGVEGVTSSFINTALIDLLDKYGFEFIKSNLLFKDTNKQINNAINSRFKFEVKKRKDLVSC